MRASSIVVAAVFAALTFALWAWLNRPSPEPPWPDHVQGMAFSPFGSGQDPVPQILPTPEQIDADLRLLGPVDDPEAVQLDLLAKLQAQGYEAFWDRDGHDDPAA
jgi:hypothetical protein